MAKILIVDDEKDVIEFLKNLLRREGFDAMGAANGKECLLLARAQRPDLILLDINMPGMDGGEVTDVLSADEETKNIPIVFLSGLVAKEEEKNIKGRLFISKVNSVEQIIQKIKNALGKP